MEKNPDYFLGVPEAAPDQVRLRYGLEPATVRTLIAHNEHDISSQWLPPEVLRSLAGEPARSSSGRIRRTGAFYIKLNTTKAPLDDVNCRLALANAFDYEAAIQIVAITDAMRRRAAAGDRGHPGGHVRRQPGRSDAEPGHGCRARISGAVPVRPGRFHTLELSWIAEVPIEERFALLMQRTSPSWASIPRSSACRGRCSPSRSPAPRTRRISRRSSSTRSRAIRTRCSTRCTIPRLGHMAVAGISER
jgi:peptide/nickel transport system substrate-binding protein